MLYGYDVDVLIKDVTNSRVPCTYSEMHNPHFCMFITIRLCILSIGC